MCTRVTRLHCNLHQQSVLCVVDGGTYGKVAVITGEEVNGEVEVVPGEKA